MKRLAAGVVGLSTAVIGVAYLLAFFPSIPETIPALLLALGTAGMLASVMALGAQRDGRLGVLWIPVVFVVLIVGGGLVGLLLMPPVDPESTTLWMGLPPRAAVLLYGVGLLPTLVVPVAYALTFETLTLSDEDLERVRRVAAERAAQDEEGETP